MPSTYTSNLGIELPADGELDGVWGDVVNDNMSIIDRAVNGSISLSLSGTSSTLTTTDGTLSDGQYKLLVLAGSPSGTHTITISPNDAQKIYFVRNTTAQSVVFTQGSGGNVTIATGDSGIIYSNGGGAAAAVVNLTDHFAMSSVKITGGSITGITDLAIADGGTGSSTAAGALTNFGLTATAAELNYTDGVTSNIQTQLDAKQPLDAELTAIAALAVTDGNFIVGDGTTWVAESGATARTSLGLGSIATQASSSVSITGGSITGITDLAIADGGTGASTAANARTNLGLAIGTDVQAWDANLDQIAALLPTANNFIVGNGTAWTLETPASALLSLGVTATAAELNTLDGITATVTELNYSDGVTSNIQTQLNAKAPLASPTFTGTLNVTGNIVATTSIDCGTQFLGLASDAATAPSFSWTGDTDTGVFRPATNSVGIATLGVERLRIASAGQIGIGGANYGTAGQVLQSNGSSAAPSWANVISTIDVQAFTASGTWTKPANAIFCEITVLGAGQGGSYGTPAVMCTPAVNGKAGNGGGLGEASKLASSLTATVAVTVGAGGTINTTAGGNGGTGGTSSFGAYVSATGGGSTGPGVGSGTAVFAKEGYFADSNTYGANSIMGSGGSGSTRAAERGAGGGGGGTTSNATVGGAGYVRVVTYCS